MGNEQVALVGQLAVPWVIIILTITSYVAGVSETILILICLLFSATVPGHAIALLLRGRLKQDPWEHAISIVLIGAPLSLIAYLLLNVTGDHSWVETTCVGLLPASAALLSMSQVAEIQRSDGGIGWIDNELFSRIVRLPLRKKVLVAAASMVLAAIVISAVFALMSIPDDEGFTEFYILNSEGHASGYPQNITLGEDAGVIIGIANHEGRPVNYTVEIWLVNYTLINMAVNVTQMYYVDSFTVLLEHQDYDMNDPWVPQYEVPVDIRPSVPGDYQLMVFLFKDEPLPIPGPSPPNGHTDYAKTEASWRIVMCVNNQINYLQLFVEVRG